MNGSMWFMQHHHTRIGWSNWRICTVHKANDKPVFISFLQKFEYIYFFIAAKSFLPGGASCGDVSWGKKETTHTNSIHNKKRWQFPWCALSTEIYGSNSSLHFFLSLVPSYFRRKSDYVCRTYPSQCVCVRSTLVIFTFVFASSFSRTIAHLLSNIRWVLFIRVLPSNWQSVDKELCRKCVQFSWCVTEKKGDDSLWFRHFCHSPGIFIILWRCAVRCASQLFQLVKLNRFRPSQVSEWVRGRKMKERNLSW